MRTWKDTITDADERKVFQALDGPQFTWRTVGGIARDAGLSEDRVMAILDKYQMSLIRRSRLPSASGRPLVGLLEKVGG
jgi:hypothetical protein